MPMFEGTVLSTETVRQDIVRTIDRSTQKDKYQANYASVYRHVAKLLQS